MGKTVEWVMLNPFYAFILMMGLCLLIDSCGKSFMPESRCADACRHMKSYRNGVCECAP